MKPLFTGLLLFSTFFLYSQAAYKKGNFTDNDGSKHECLIKAMDWKLNPESFKYKLNKRGKVHTASIKSVESFAIDGGFVYKRHTLRIDTSSDGIKDMSYSEHPMFVERTLFLKVLIEGTASLYQYRNKEFERYFYSTDSVELEQLVYKPYRTVENVKRENKYYRQQIWVHLKCKAISMDDVAKTTYTEKDLTTIFKFYNKTCRGVEPVQYSGKPSLNFSIRPGLNYSSFNLDYYFPNQIPADFNSQLSFRIGSFIEFNPAFNKNKWSVFTEPTFQSFSSTSELYNHDMTMTYSSIELPLGMRYYMYLNNRSKIFVSAAYVLDFTLESILTYNDLPPYDDKSNSSSAAYGVGYIFENTFSIEARFLLNRELLKDHSPWTGKFNSASLILGYRIF